MRWKRSFSAAAVLAATSVTFGAGYALSALQDREKMPPQGDEMKMEMPKPGPEHARMAKAVGNWDAEIESMMGGPPTKSKGTETVKAQPGGLWFISEFKGDFGGMPFHGNAISGFDPAKGKYVGAWADNFGTHLATMEGTYDEKTKTSTTLMDAPGPTGEMVKHKMLEKWIDDDTRTFEMFMPDPDGKDMQVMKITYKRRK